MRIGVNPTTSDAHRRAVTILYRALLKATYQFSTPAICKPLHSLIRHRFYKDRLIKSPYAISDALKLGRNSHVLLRSAASGHVDALSQLTDVLALVAARAEDLGTERRALAEERKPPRPGKLKKIAHLERIREVANRTRRGERIGVPVLERPVPKEQLPEPDKPRRVPKFVVARGIPFLRYGSGRHQSVTLSGVFRQLAQHDTRQWDVALQVEKEIDHAILEDNWDRFVWECTGVRDEIELDEEDEAGESENEWEAQTSFKKIRRNRTGSGLEILWGSQSWTRDLREVLSQTKLLIRESFEKRAETGRQLFDVLLKEKALAEEEAEERRALKKTRELSR